MHLISVYVTRVVMEVVAAVEAIAAAAAAAAAEGSVALSMSCSGRRYRHRSDSSYYAAPLRYSIHPITSILALCRWRR